MTLCRRGHRRKVFRQRGGLGAVLEDFQPLPRQWLGDRALCSVTAAFSGGGDCPGTESIVQGIQDALDVVAAAVQDGPFMTA